MISFHRFFPMVILACLVGASAGAQTPAPAPAPAPVPADPSVTTATFGDWVLRCQKLQQADLPPKLCEVALSIQLQGQTSTFAQIAIGGLPRQPLRMTIAVPPNISLPGGLKASVGEKAAGGVALAWARCLPAACIAEAIIMDDILRLWRAGETAQMSFLDGSNRELKVSFKLRGLAQALDALAKS